MSWDRTVQYMVTRMWDRYLVNWQVENDGHDMSQAIRPSVLEVK